MEDVQEMKTKINGCGEMMLRRVGEGNKRKAEGE